jgi:hypothetical protein
MSAEEDTGDYSQVSLAIVTPPNLVGQWKKVQAKEISLKEAEELAVQNEH